MRASRSSDDGELFRSSLKSGSHTREPVENHRNGMSQNLANSSSLCGSSHTASVTSGPLWKEHEPRSQDQGLATGTSSSRSSSRRRTSQGLDKDRATPTTPGDRTISWREESSGHPQDRASRVGEQNQQGPRQEGSADRAVHQGLGADANGERDNSHSGTAGAAESALGVETHGRGCGGIRTPCCSGVPRHQPVPAVLQGVGAAHSSRRVGMRLPLETIGPVAEGKSRGEDREGGGSQAPGHGQEEGEARAQRRVRFKLDYPTGDGPRHAPDLAEPHEHDAGFEVRGGRAEGRETSEEGPSKGVLREATSEGYMKLDPK